NGARRSSPSNAGREKLLQQVTQEVRSPRELIEGPRLPTGIDDRLAGQKVGQHRGLAPASPVDVDELGAGFSAVASVACREREVVTDLVRIFKSPARPIEISSIAPPQLERDPMTIREDVVLILIDPRDQLRAALIATVGALEECNVDQRLIDQGEASIIPFIETRLLLDGIYIPQPP